jgi:uncharacterized protein involved in cysteine biosynthesis
MKIDVSITANGKALQKVGVKCTSASLLHKRLLVVPLLNVARQPHFLQCNVIGWHGKLKRNEFSICK